MPMLEVWVGDQRVERRELPRGRTRVGRSAADNELSFEHLGVRDLSARHLEIWWDADGLRLVDLGSKNGTRLNGALVAVEARLDDGDEIVAGAIRLVVRSAPVGALDALEWAVERLGSLYAAPTVAARLAVLVREARAISGADVAWAVQWDGPATSPRYRLLVHEGGPAELPDPGAISTSILGRAARSGRAVWTDDATADVRFRDAVSVRRLQVHAAGAIPLGAAGALYLAHTRLDRGSAGARARVEALCRVASPLLEVQRATSVTATSDEVLPGVIGRSRAMVELAEQVRTFAGLGYRILLLGERGTGKSLVARAIHQLSGVTGDLVLGDCPTIVPTLAESTLFGHEKGSFANATHRHVGWVARANEGTLFLDEVGELPPEIQPKLLTLLEDGTFEPIGATRRQTFTGRIIAATNRDLDDRTAPFRRDLLDRLAQVVFRIPPLRERAGDIALLARHVFERETARLSDRGATPPVELSEEAITFLGVMPLEGNVRELQSVLFNAIGRALQERCDEVLPRHLDGVGGEPVRAATAYWDKVHAFERDLLEQALSANAGNQTRARRALGLSNGAWDRAKKRTGL